MPEIAEWLKALGMSEYAERFAENGIDISVLCHLTDQDLKDIGVLLGHRRKLLAPIAELAGTVPAAPQPTLAETKPHDVAERRQLTVLFCDLVGSTALASRLDPEDLREIIGVYHRCVADTVGRFDGFVAKYMGDGVLVYISATRRRTRTTPNRRYGPAWLSLTPSCDFKRPSRCGSASALAPGRSSLAI